jgi:dihydrofolate reductase
MEIILIVAIAEGNAIGYNNDLLAFISADLKRFKALTTGHTIVMGRKTFESLPKGALPNRRNIVLSRDPSFKAEGAETVTSVDDTIALCQPTDTLFVIGGASVYEAFLPKATQLKITLIHHTFEKADTFFPSVNWEQWQETARIDVTDDEKAGFGYSFVDYVKKNH